MASPRKKQIFAAIWASLETVGLSKLPTICTAISVMCVPIMRRAGICSHQGTHNTNAEITSAKLM